MPEYYGSTAYNILQIDHGNGYVTQYWHCDTHTVTAGTTVAAGDPVATVGDKGAPGAYHLHLEVLKDGVPVDPYGWTGAGADPYTAATSVNLWGTPPNVGGAIACMTTCQGNTLCAGTQCLLQCDADADCPGSEVCRAGFCAPACAADVPGACLGESAPVGGEPVAPQDSGGCAGGPGGAEGVAWLVLALLGLSRRVSRRRA